MFEGGLSNIGFGESFAKSEAAEGESRPQPCVAENCDFLTPNPNCGNCIMPLADPLVSIAMADSQKGAIKYSSNALLQLSSSSFGSGRKSGYIFGTDTDHSLDRCRH